MATRRHHCLKRLAAISGFVVIPPMSLFRAVEDAKMSMSDSAYVTLTILTGILGLGRLVKRVKNTGIQLVTRNFIETPPLSFSWLSGI